MFYTSIWTQITSLTASHDEVWGKKKKKTRHPYP